MSNFSDPSTSDRPFVNIAYIGGGSRYWARDLMKDLALQARFDGEIALYDLDHDAAKKNVEIGTRIFAREEAGCSFKLRAVHTLKACLRNADFVVISIEPGDTELRYADLVIPERYGIIQPVGDTTGPGGWLRALRSVPTFATFAHAIMDICPDAWVINYTNPMTLCTAALYEAEPDIKAFGCCHEVFGTQTRLQRMAEDSFGMKGLTRADIHVDVTGINHFTWITSATCHGKDLMPLVREKLQDPATLADRTRPARKRLREGKVFESDGLVALDLARRFGALACAGDRHLVEFVPWYARDRKTLHRWGVVCTSYEYRMKARGGEDPDVDTYDQQKMNPTGEEGVRQMEALLGIADLDTNVNLPNRGQCPDLPPGAVVETNAAFRHNALTPLTAKAMPPGARTLVRRIVDVQGMTLRAAMNRDLDAAIQALYCDPLVTIPTDKAAEMAKEMIGHIRPMLTDKRMRPPYPTEAVCG